MVENCGNVYSSQAGMQHRKDLSDMYGIPIIQVIKPRGITSAGHAAHMGEEEFAVGFL
jgi:hypothetical protein